jgi:hypothetical protein
VKLAVVNPETAEIFTYQNGEFISFIPVTTEVTEISASELATEIAATHENLPVYLLKNSNV